MWSELAESWRYRAVVENYVNTSLGVRYRRSVLGYLWTVLSPVAKFAIMGVVFNLIGRFNMPHYYGFMFIGSIFFGFISTVVGASTRAFIDNEHYIKKIYVPKLVFVLNIVLFELVNFLLVLVAVVALLLCLGEVTVAWTWLFLPVALAITVVALVGVATLVAVATIWFRDLQHLVDILFQALFFATPIFYPLSTIEPHKIFYTLALCNPVLYFVSLFRDPLVNGTLPDVGTLVIAAGLAVTFLGLGLLLLKKFNNRIIFKL